MPDCRCPACLPGPVSTCYRIGGYLLILGICIVLMSIALWSRGIFGAGCAVVDLGSLAGLLGVALEEASFNEDEDEDDD